MIGLLTSSVGRKYLMALSGIIWAGFIFGHMAGNLLIFVGPDVFNAYGHAIVSNKALLYATEAALILSLLPHVWTGFKLSVDNWKARKTRYAKLPKGPKKARFGSRTMIFQGSIILVFIILHLITFKYGTYYETTVDGIVMRDLYRLTLEVFQQPGYVIWYLVALVLLGVHLSHGLKSAVQSFGFRKENYSRHVTTLAAIYALVVAGGFISQPLYVFLFH